MAIVVVVVVVAAAVVVVAAAVVVVVALFLFVRLSHVIKKKSYKAERKKTDVNRYNEQAMPYEMGDEMS